MEVAYSKGVLRAISARWETRIRIHLDTHRLIRTYDTSMPNHTSTKTQKNGEIPSEVSEPVFLFSLAIYFQQLALKA